MIDRMLVSSKPGVVFIESIGAALFDLVSKNLTVIVVHSIISNLVDKCCSDIHRLSVQICSSKQTQLMIDKTNKMLIMMNRLIIVNGVYDVNNLLNPNTQ